MSGGENSSARRAEDVESADPADRSSALRRAAEQLAPWFDELDGFIDQKDIPEPLAQEAIELLVERRRARTAGHEPHEEYGGKTVAATQQPAPRRGSALEREWTTYQARKPELLDHEGQFVLIKDDEVIGFWPTLEEVLDAGYTRFGLVPFFVKEIRRVEPVLFLPDLR